eukprot:99531-Rhodomonas_salina.1
MMLRGIKYYPELPPTRCPVPTPYANPLRGVQYRPTPRRPREIKAAVAGSQPKMLAAPLMLKVRNQSPFLSHSVHAERPLEAEKSSNSAEKAPDMLERALFPFKRMLFVGTALMAHLEYLRGNFSKSQVRPRAPIYGSQPAAYARNTAIYGCNAAIYGDATAMYGGIAVVRWYAAFAVQLAVINA